MGDEAKITSCGLQFAFECPKTWDSLAVTANPAMRFCCVCQKNVHFCDTEQKARQKAIRGLCVALSATTKSEVIPTSTQRLVADTTRLTMRIGSVANEAIKLPTTKRKWKKRGQKRGRSSRDSMPDNSN